PDFFEIHPAVVTGLLPFLLYDVFLAATHIL
ncbi:MAG: hypothetical protein H6Q73_4453, partial [Firmicutes bacterium]|nr:hypothetical protein [Bacillota bacterium]